MSPFRFGVRGDRGLHYYRGSPDEGFPHPALQPDMKFHPFEGKVGRARLVASLRKQEVVHDDAEVARLLAEVVDIVEMRSGDTIIDQDGDDDSLFFVLCGEAAVVVNGSTIAFRRQHQHVGEMALLDPTATRSAHVVARGDVVLARISEARFAAIAEGYPMLWRRLGIELGSRVRVGNSELRIPNPTPIVFVCYRDGSSALAPVLCDALETEGFVVRLWSDSGVFGASRFAIDSFTTQVAGSDFALYVLGADTAHQDEVKCDAVFELGVFVGLLGKDRTMLLRPKALRLTLPSDHVGFATVPYSPDPALQVEHAAAAASIVRRRIEKLGPR